MQDVRLKFRVTRFKEPRKEFAPWLVVNEEGMIVGGCWTEEEARRLAAKLELTNAE